MGLRKKVSSALRLHHSKEKSKSLSGLETLPLDVWKNFLRNSNIQQIKALRLTSKTLCKSLSSILFQATELSNKTTKAANAEIIKRLVDRDPENISEFLYDVSWPILHSDDFIGEQQLDRYFFGFIEDRITSPIKYLLSVEGKGEVPKFGKLQKVSIRLEPPDNERYVSRPFIRDPRYSLQAIRHEVVRGILTLISKNKNIEDLTLGPIEMSIFITPKEALLLRQPILRVDWIVRLEKLQIEFTTETMGLREGHHNAYKNSFDTFRMFLAHAKSLMSLTLKYPIESCPLKAAGDWYSPDEVPSHFGRDTALNRLKHLELVQSWISHDFCNFIRGQASSLQELVFRDCFCFAQTGKENTTWSDLFAAILEGDCSTKITSLQVITSLEYIMQRGDAWIGLWRWGQTEQSPCPDPRWERRALKEDRIKPLYLVLKEGHRLVPSDETRKRAINNDDQAPYDLVQAQIEDNCKGLQDARDFEAERVEFVRALIALFETKGLQEVERGGEVLQGNDDSSPDASFERR
ncbi:hypothetical protein KEM56_000834 [Ascosphaera pollenicola]|nr:hypothetical protein KEM56_000834 [Ascosphaera pollenicola]